MNLKRLRVADHADLNNSRHRNPFGYDLLLKPSVVHDEYWLLYGASENKSEVGRITQRRWING